MFTDLDAASAALDAELAHLHATLDSLTPAVELLTRMAAALALLANERREERRP